MVNSEFRLGIWGAATLVGFVVAGVITCVQQVSSEQAADDVIELKFDLPEAFFGGTPFDGHFPNLEFPNYRGRSPFLAPIGTQVLSRGKPVTSSAPPLNGELEQVTDGNKNHEIVNAVELPMGSQWVQVDLQAEHQLFAILLWHNHHGKNVYFDVIGQISNDPEFKTGVTQIYNNDIDNSSGLGRGYDKDYIESAMGRLFDLRGQRGRYIRFYSNGSVFAETNHVSEIEVWGKEITSNTYPYVTLEFELPRSFHGVTPIERLSPPIDDESFRPRPPFWAPEGTRVLSRGKSVSSSAVPTRGTLDQVTDGNKNHEPENSVEFPNGLQWVQVDLDEEVKLYAILVWHYYYEKRVYSDVICHVSNDLEFKTGTTQVFNNDIDNSLGFGIGRDDEYIESFQGRLFDPKGIRGRYVRFYSHGNHVDDLNHTIEIEVWGVRANDV